MHADLLNPSRYLKAAEFLGADVTYTIERVKHEEMERDDNTSENRGIIFFKEVDKGWVMNVVNAKSLAAMFGTETDNWVGKRVTLWPDPNVKAFGQIVTAIRVRGSPDLERPVMFSLKTRKKKPRDVKLVPTGKPAAGQQRQQPAGNKPPSVFSRIQQLATDYEFPRGEKDADLLALVKKTCPERKSSAELTEEDFTAIEAAMVEAMKQPADGDPPVTF